MSLPAVDEVEEAAEESGKTVQRYVWLARLSDELLDMVDKKKIGIPRLFQFFIIKLLMFIICKNHVCVVGALRPCS